VENAAVVRGGDPGADLAGDLDGLVPRKPADTTEERGQILSVHELHREGVLPLDLADVVDAADVRVRDLPCGPDFVEEAAEPRRVPSERLGQEFQSHRLAQLQIVGPVDLPHPSLAENPDDPIATGQDRPGNETALVERSRGGAEPAAGRSRSSF